MTVEVDGFLFHFLADFGADIMSKSRLTGSDAEYHRVNTHTTAVVKRQTLNLPFSGCQTHVWALIRGSKESFRGGEPL